MWWGPEWSNGVAIEKERMCCWRYSADDDMGKCAVKMGVSYNVVWVI